MFKKLCSSLDCWEHKIPSLSFIFSLESKWTHADICIEDDLMLSKQDVWKAMVFPRHRIPSSLRCQLRLFPRNKYAYMNMWKCQMTWHTAWNINANGLYAQSQCPKIDEHSFKACLAHQVKIIIYTSENVCLVVWDKWQGKSSMPTLPWIGTNGN